MNLKTRLRSLGARYFASQGFLEKTRQRAIKQRQRKGEPPCVHYFHQVDDPYSHLAAQKLEALQARYDIVFNFHLCAPEAKEYQGSAEHFATWAKVDAASVAADYNVTFTPTVNQPAAAHIDSANRVLADHLHNADFAALATEVGNALWSGQAPTNEAATNDPSTALAAGSSLRSKLGHYQGGMFYYEGEWFWGVDRLRSLEARLVADGFSRDTTTICVPQPTPDTPPKGAAAGITLEYFPSLRSPYTAIGHQRVLDLIEQTGVAVKVRPVMPMLMRGIPAPRAKQRYIITDAAREGRAFGVPFGKMVDPFGEPVKRAFALFPGALELDAALPFVTAYLNAAWFEGVDITNSTGLRTVVANAGLDWQRVNQAAEMHDWQALLAANLDSMFACNLWGVPSFRVSGGTNPQAFACWGQDRIWRVASEIARRV